MSGSDRSAFGWARHRLPPLVQRHPVEAVPAESTGYRFLVLVGRPVWAYRLELLIAGTLLLAWAQLSRLLPSVLALVAIGLLVALALWPARARRLVLQLSRRARLRRWERASRHAGLATLNDRIPRVRTVTVIPAGEQLRVRLPVGARVAHLEEAADALAAMLEVREVRVARDRTNARYAAVTIVRRDPLAAEAQPWPLVAAERSSLWAPMPVGVDETGQVVSVSLVERNLLLGGEPGSGKSVALSLLVAAAALDPAAELVLLDGKQVELAPWARSALRTVGPSVAEAVAVLDELRIELDARYAVLLGEGRRKVAAGDGLPLRLVVIDELAFYLWMGERNECSAFATGLRDLVARGRAAGIIVLAATQKPSAEIVPTGVRDLFAFRWALRCTTSQASDTILGQGGASSGCSAAEVDAACRAGSPRSRSASVGAYLRTRSGSTSRL